ncbi:MAG: DUF1553 domain-containing protein, partial [Phycisphaeraceae bacterium]|nr:DUF1553 domain-containing protein [Phycisphaeraceae bacterium]
HSLEGSEAWQLIVSPDADEKMPPPEAKKPLTQREISILKQWIEQGAPWSDHWSFVPPKKPPLPKISDPKWPKNSIDHFVMAQLDRRKLSPSPQADRRTLIRRVSFDLRGLPPTPQQVKRFVEDQAPDAYEKMIDRMLASRHFGERMALMWLDAARYGDTSVYHADGPRDMWAWRDGVIRSYNANKPFNQFSTEQIAGDLIPNATLEQKIASGFNRNNGTTDEGGLIEEEYRVEYAVDRVKTTSMVWLGLSMECAQCHEHKFDPISQTDYYRFFAFFNVSEDRGKQTRKGNAKPMVSVPDPEKQKRLQSVTARLAEQEKKLKAREASIEAPFRAWVQKMQTAAANGEASAQPTDAALHLKLDEGKGKKIQDAANTKRKAVIKGRARWTDGKFGKALRLDGRNYVDLGQDIGDFERTDSFSVGGWFYFDGKSTGAIVARMDDGNQHRGWDLYTQNRGQLAMHLIHAWPDNAIKVATGKKMKKGWHHVMATYDGSSKTEGVGLYVDGEKWVWKPEKKNLAATIKTGKNTLVGRRHSGSRIKGRVDEIQIYNRRLNDAQVRALAGSDPLGPIFKIASAKRTPKQVQMLRHHYLHTVDGPYKKLLAERDRLRKEVTDLKKPMTTVMVMSDMAKPRPTFVLAGGAYDAPTKERVEPGIPRALGTMPEGAPKNRLGLAQWLFDKDHPLTARVAVNRYWQMLFGQGLVATPEDFGSQGEFPSHPKLLDWLATDFRDHGWNIKRTIKQILMSATYRQQSNMSAELAAADPKNRRLARGPKFRLPGEFIRDNALALSGLLVDRMGGPGVKPYQPPGLWAEVGLSGKPKFRQDKGEKLYRRSIYTYWKRSAPPPSLQIFDAPTREKCTIRRPRTNTPLQALVTLNDVQFVEAARHFARRLMTEAGPKPADRIRLGFLMATARPPTKAERAILKKVLDDALAHYRADPETAKKLLSFGDSKRDEKLDAAEHAAWTIVASTLMNLDETLTRG